LGRDDTGSTVCGGRDGRLRTVSSGRDGRCGLVGGVTVDSGGCGRCSTLLVKFDGVEEDPLLLGEDEQLFPG
jgi:hypothetical protein